MKLSTVLPFFLAGSTLAVVENINLSKDPVHNCGGTTQYSKADIQRAAEAALRHHNEGTTVGDRNYPHHFGNYNNQVPLVANCAGLGLEEFPLVKTIEYPGGTPAAPRVAVSYINADTVRLCAVMAHKKGDVFYGCDWRNSLRFEL